MEGSPGAYNQPLQNINSALYTMDLLGDAGAEKRSYKKPMKQNYFLPSMIKSLERDMYHTRDTDVPRGTPDVPPAGSDVLYGGDRDLISSHDYDYVNVVDKRHWVNPVVACVKTRCADKMGDAKLKCVIEKCHKNLDKDKEKDDKDE